MDPKIKVCVDQLYKLTEGLDVDERNQIIDLYPEFVSGIIKSNVSFPEFKHGMIYIPMETQIVGPRAVPAPIVHARNPIKTARETETSMQCPHCGEKIVMTLKS